MHVEIREVVIGGRAFPEYHWNEATRCGGQEATWGAHELGTETEAKFVVRHCWSFSNPNNWGDSKTRTVFDRNGENT